MPHHDFLSFLLHLAMPLLPPAAIFTPPSHTPPAPCEARGDWQAPTPGDPAGIFARPVFGGDGSLLVTGSLNVPQLVGAMLLPVDVPKTLTGQMVDEPQWSSDGFTAVGSGEWNTIVTAGLYAKTDTTPDALAPPIDLYDGDGSQADGSSLYVSYDATVLFYNVCTLGGFKKWSRDNATDHGGETIPAGAFVQIISKLPGTEVTYPSGLGAVWQADATVERRFDAKAFLNYGPNPKKWYGKGLTPQAATWTPSGGASGTPVVSNAGVSPPCQIHSQPAYTPGAPHAIRGNHVPGSPAAPRVITPSHAPGSPAAAHAIFAKPSPAPGPPRAIHSKPSYSPGPPAVIFTP